MARNLTRFLLRLGTLCLCAFFLTAATCSEIYTRNGTWYRVKSGDSVSSVASRFKTNQASIVKWNKLPNKKLQVGQRLFIPRDRRYARASSRKSSKPNSTRSIEPKGRSIGRNKFIWPVNGIVTSKYGIRRGRRHDGIDISVPRGTPIKASDSGEVVFSSKLRGYGNLILVKHRSNVFTVYAHNSRNLKKKGDKVKKGEVIARVGSTGRASGPHLHFEVRRGSNAKNPMSFLPKQGYRLAKQK